MSQSDQQQQPYQQVGDVSQEQQQIKDDRARIDRGNMGGRAEIAAEERYNREQQQYQQDLARLNQASQDMQRRPPMSATGAYYLGYSHDDLKKMVTDNMNPGVVGTQGADWNKFGNNFVDFANEITRISNSSQHGWEGAAADGARSYMGSLSTWTGQSGQGMQVMGKQVHQLADAASQAQHSMPPPVNFGMGDALKMMATSAPWNWSNTAHQIQQKYDQKQQAHEQAAQVLSTQAQSYSQISSTMPEFPSPPTMQPGGGQPPVPPPPLPGPPGGWGGGGGYGGGGGGVGAYGGLPGGGGGAGAGGGWNPGGQPRVPPQPGPPGSGPIGTRPVHDYPVGTNPVGWTGDPVHGGRGGPGGGLGSGPGTGGGHGGDGIGAMPVFGAGGGVGGGGGGVGGGGGGRLGAGGVGAGGAGSGRLGPGGVAGAAEPEGRMPGARGAMGAGAAGRAGAAGMGGPMGGGQRGGGGEDGEHQRPGYLVETDEGVWTDGIPPTAPPVIGG